MKRRAFIKEAGAGALLMSVNPGGVFGSGKRNSGPDLQAVTSDDYPFPYDDRYFECSPRVFFPRADLACINLVPKKGITVEGTLHVLPDGDTAFAGASSMTQSFSLDDSLDIPIPVADRPRFVYWIEYKTDGGGWNATPRITVKTPGRSPGDPVKIALYGDPHVFDDADRNVQDPFLREARINGEHFKILLRELNKNPRWMPTGELRQLRQAFCFASGMTQIRLRKPDFVWNLGDDNGGGAHKWMSLGLPRLGEMTDEQLYEVEQKFRLGMRKGLSGLAWDTEICWALGNHDGEAGFYRTREFGAHFRLKYFKQPGALEFCSEHENYHFRHLGDTRLRSIGRSGVLQMGNVLFITLDVMRYNSAHPVTPDQWTLGPEQKAWLEKILSSAEAHWKIVAFHHVLGGWPAGSDERETHYAYGRGPLFTSDDYASIGLNPEAIEQVALTEMMRRHGVDIIFYGHDHVFHVKRLGKNSKNREMCAICVGSTKADGEENWWEGRYWKQFYGRDFWGPSGFTLLSLNGDEAVVEYICSAISYYTNIPPWIEVGDTVQRVVL